jgi:hypothetical protein
MITERDLISRKSVQGLGQTTSAQPTLYDAIQAAGPAIVGLSRQYQRAAPLIDWLIDHPLLAVAVFVGSISGAALVGATIGASGVLGKMIKVRET